MVAQRRFGPLVWLVFAAIALVAARLFQVQVLEHEIWAREASSLVRTSRIVASHRGRFLDRNGRELVRDEDCYEIEFKYREFRRGHPIGHAALFEFDDFVVILPGVPVHEGLADQVKEGAGVAVVAG